MWLLKVSISYFGASSFSFRFAALYGFAATAGQPDGNCKAVEPAHKGELPLAQGPTAYGGLSDVIEFPSG